MRSSPYAMPNRRRKIIEVERPNLGLYLDRKPMHCPDRGFPEGKNFRIRDGSVSNLNIGRTELFPYSLGSPVRMIETYQTVNGTVFTVFGTEKDLAVYDPSGPDADFITPIYTTGTVSTTSGSPVVTGSGTTWLANASIGDFIFIGSATARSASLAWAEVLSVDSDTQITLTENFGSTGSGQAYTIRQTFSMASGAWWDAVTFTNAPIGSVSGLGAGDHFFATNGSQMIVWDGSSLQVSLIDLGFSCRTLDVYKNMMIFGRTTDSGNVSPGSVKNSAIGDPENVLTLEAGEVIAIEGPDEILATRRLGDLLAVYAENSIAVMQFIGPPQNFVIRTVSSRVGLFGPKAIADFGNYHEFLSDDRGYRFDGVQLVPFGDQVLTDVLRKADIDRKILTTSSISEEHLEVYWLVPSTEDGSEADAPIKNAYVEHYAEDVGRSPVPFSHREVDAFSIGSYLEQSAQPVRFSDYTSEEFSELTFRFNDRFFSLAFPKTIVGGADGKIYELNTANSFPGTLQLLSYVVTPRRAIGSVDAKGVIRRIEPVLERFSGAANSIAMLPRVYDRPDGESSIKVSKEVAVDHTTKRFSSHRISGRYGDVFMGTSFANQTWSLIGYKVTIDETHPR